MGGQILDYEVKRILRKGRAEGQLKIIAQFLKKNTQER